MFKEANFTDLPAIHAAHAHDISAATGITVFIAENGCTCGVDVRGGAPATRETDLLKPENMIEKIHAVVIGGGSAFGLEACCGVAEALSKRGIGFTLAGQTVPIVCGACLFDLPIGAAVWPDKEMGEEACHSALEGNSLPLACGNVGAGTGATIGKMGLPSQAMKSGFGWSGIKLGELVVIANVAVNAVGNVMAEDGSFIAGVLNSDRHILSPFEAALAAQMSAAQTSAASHIQNGAQASTNTTLGVILTNADLTKAQATKVSQISQDAYARCIKPVHTLNDGDAIFTMATGEVKTNTDLVGMMATEAMERAIRKAVLSAQSAYGLTAASDLR